MDRESSVYYCILPEAVKVLKGPLTTTKVEFPDLVVLVPERGLHIEENRMHLIKFLQTSNLEKSMLTISTLSNTSDDTLATSLPIVT